MRRLLLVLPSLLCAGSVAAASLDLPGTYGSPAGCKYVADQVYGDETVSILDSEHYENFVTYCEFVQVLGARDGSKIVTLLCGHEGDSEQTIELVRIVKSTEADSYEIFSADGGGWASVDRCQAPK